jgi:NAD(P)-dependent dehydrogenase (short-subunit alcohol dehydrogenase family)
MKGKKFLVVGGSSGIGLALVTQLSDSGAAVWVWSRSVRDLEALPNVHHQEVDITAESLPDDDLPEELDGVAYCPGTINLKPFRSLSKDQFKTDWEVNFLGAVSVLQLVEKRLKKAPTASVVLFSTVAVGRGMSFHTSVAAAKGAIEGFGRSLAAEWAPKIRVNIIAPSLTDTPLAERLLSSDERRKTAAERHPLKRYAQPEEIANLALYLLTSESGYITGQVLGIDGGLSAI